MRAFLISLLVLLVENAFGQSASSTIGARAAALGNSSSLLTDEWSLLNNIGGLARVKLTGSIGVFGMIPNLENTLKNKLGITFDTVKTSKYAAMNGVLIAFSDDEGKIIQQSIDSTYEKFLSRVAQCRHKTRDEVHAVAQGRIWLGTKGKEIGLVDEIGGLEDAIKAAASKAQLKDYKTVEYPKFKNPFQKFVENLTGDKSTDDMTQSAIKRELGEYYPYYEQFKKMQTMKGPQMRVPFMVSFK